MRAAALPLATRRIRILAVDDFPDTLEILSTMLLPYDYDVVEARNGIEALARFDEVEPDLVLLDVAMPGMSGIDVCREIKSRTAGRFVPVILLTAYAASENKVEGLGAGADDYITKPFDPDEVQARIQAMLRIKALQDDIRITQPITNPPARKEKELTILFADIRGFTKIADQVNPGDVTRVLDLYLEAMSEVIFENFGTVNKLMGDGIMVMFNDPVAQEDHALRGLRTGLAMCERARTLGSHLRTILPEPFTIGIGLHTGVATVGNIGCSRLRDYTAIGPSVNLASRLQGLAVNNRLVASSAVYGPLGKRVRTAHERFEKIRGFAKPVKVADVVGIA